jgi:arylformamidase
MSPHVTADWIDISVTLRNGMPQWPGDEPFQITMAEEIRNGGSVNLCQISGSAHTGTHMDAPRHFIDGGQTLDTMPFSATVGRARVIEIRDPQAIRRSELERYAIQSGERILFKTANSRELWKLRGFQQKFVSIPPETAEYLASAALMTVGIDYLSVGPFGESGAETHRILLRAGIWIIEGLNLDGVEPGEYDFVCLPMKIENSDGAPARAIVRKL